MTSRNYTSPYELNGIIPLAQAVPLGLQHVLAMFVGNLSPLLIIMGVCSITVGAGFGDLRVSLLQNAMFIAGVVTLLQLYPLGPIGGKLPIVMGTSSGFIGINNSIAAATVAEVHLRRFWNRSRGADRHFAQPHPSQRRKVTALDRSGPAVHSDPFFKNSV